MANAYKGLPETVRPVRGQIDGLWRILTI